MRVLVSSLECQVCQVQRFIPLPIGLANTGNEECYVSIHAVMTSLE